ncbi:MAG TPA: carbohydrate-binding domain-containing protein [Stellaceae bacterium]|nr:carbohydrate-binding domain-containing protein [Stellaceae bacterium]
MKLLLPKAVQAHAAHWSEAGCLRISLRRPARRKMIRPGKIPGVFVKMRSAFALAAALAAVIGFSAASSAASVAITADSLSVSGCSANRPIGGGVVALYCAGDIHGSVDFPPAGDGTYQISVVARGELGFGVIFPDAQVSIDGAVVGNITVRSSSFSTYTLNNVAVSAGTHTLSIAYANGYNSAFPGMGLYIKSIGITPSGSVPAPPSNPPPSVDAYQQQLLGLINGSRAGAGLGPLTFSSVQSAGTASCVGSYGHSVHMAQVGQISHDQFPQDICIPWSAAGENVGVASGSESGAIQTLHQQMMNEGPGGGHYQNIMSSTFTTIGIGLYYVNNTLWLTEDFVK